MDPVSFNAFKDFIRSCAFIHDDPDPYSGVDWDHHGLNPFLLGCEVCVAGNIDGFGDNYIEYARKIDIFPREVIVPKYKTDYLVDNLLNDPKALLLLRNYVQNLKLDISTFYPYKDQNFYDLVGKLASEKHTPRVHPLGSVFYYLNDKIYLRSKMSEKNIPIPEGQICNTFKDLESFFLHAERLQRAILIKKYHFDTREIANLDELYSVKEYLEYPLVVEIKYDVASSPIWHGLFWQGVCFPLFTADQVITNNKHAGNSTPTGLPHQFEHKIEELSKEVASLFVNFIGVFGVDFIVTTDGKLLVVDVNPRFNSSTYTLYLLNRLKLGPVTSRYSFIKCNIKDLSALMDIEDFPFFSFEWNEGVIPFCPVYNRVEHRVEKFSFLCIGKSMKIVDQMIATIKQSVNKIS